MRGARGAFMIDPEDPASGYCSAEGKTWTVRPVEGECAVCGGRVPRYRLKERRNAGGRIELACPECLKSRPSLEDETRAGNAMSSEPRTCAEGDKEKKR